VDVYGAIHPNERDLTLIRTYPTDPVNFVHLNDAGYAAAGAQFVSAAGLSPVPAPPAVVLAVVGVLILGGRRGLRRAGATVGTCISN
jgi:hypothetical protein